MEYSNTFTIGGNNYNIGFNETSNIPNNNNVVIDHDVNNDYYLNLLNSLGNGLNNIVNGQTVNVTRGNNNIRIYKK